MVLALRERDPKLVKEKKNPHSLISAENVFREHCQGFSCSGVSIKGALRKKNKGSQPYPDLLFLGLASRKRCDFEIAKTLRFAIADEKNAAIFFD